MRVGLLPVLVALPLAIGCAHPRANSSSARTIGVGATSYSAGLSLSPLKAEESYYEGSGLALCAGGEVGLGERLDVGAHVATGVEDGHSNTAPQSPRVEANIHAKWQFVGEDASGAALALAPTAVVGRFVTWMRFYCGGNWDDCLDRFNVDYVRLELPLVYSVGSRELELQLRAAPGYEVMNFAFESDQAWWSARDRGRTPTFRSAYLNLRAGLAMSFGSFGIVLPEVGLTFIGTGENMPEAIFAPVRLDVGLTFFGGP